MTVGLKEENILPRSFNRCVVSEHVYKYEHLSGFRSHSVYREMEP